LHLLCCDFSYWCYQIFVAPFHLAAALQLISATRDFFSFGFVNHGALVIPSGLCPAQCAKLTFQLIFYGIYFSPKQFSGRCFCGLPLGSFDSSGAKTQPRSILTRACSGRCSWSPRVCARDLFSPHEYISRSTSACVSARVIHFLSQFFSVSSSALARLDLGSCHLVRSSVARAEQRADPFSGQCTQHRSSAAQETIETDCSPIFDCLDCCRNSSR
jgi:hypothetical protein